MSKKELAKKLREDFKKSQGGLGGLAYSGSPMQWDKHFNKQADEILKAQQFQANSQKLYEKQQEKFKEQQKQWAEMRQKIQTPGEKRAHDYLKEKERKLKEFLKRY